MKRLITTFFALCLLLPALAQVPAGYYSSASGQTGPALKTALYNIIKGHQKFPYSSSSTDTWDILKEADRDPNNANNVLGIYSGFSMDGPKEYDGGNGWNREHVWAKSRGDFGTSPGAGTDTHHLRAADISTNSARSNRNFDEASNPYVDGSGQYSGATGSFTSSSSFVWEPRAEVKGDVARMIFYMATRYEGENGEPDLELTETLLNQSDKSPLQGKLSVLLAWHAADPVDAAEQNRNNIIFSYQGNRNPFIDHPEYVASIWGAAPTPTLSFNSSPVTTATEGQAYSYSIATANANGAVAIVATTKPAWANLTDNGNGTAILSGTPSAADVASTPVVISATDTDGTISQSFTLVVSGSNNGGGGNNGGGNSTGQSTELLFSEYIEGSSFNKGLEIANFTGSDVDLTPYTIATQVNGSTTWGTPFDLSGTVTDGDVYVVVNNSADPSMQAAADVTTGSSALSFNGNDVIGLFNNGVLIDIIGVSGSSANFAKDVTKVRNSDVTNPTNVYDASQWTNFPRNTFSDLGTHTMDAPALAAELFFSEYIEGSSFNKGLEIANYTGADVDLTNYTLATQVNGSTSWGTPYNLAGSAINNDVFVVVNASADATMLAASDANTSTTALNFNGNDVVGLFKGGTLIDIIGTSGSSANFAKDVTKVRNADVRAPVTTYDPSEWTDFARNTFTDLGSHTINGGGGPTPTAPTAPTASILASTTALTLSWNDVADEDSYTVYRATDGANFAQVATPAANSTSYVDNGVVLGTTYSYYVTASNAQGSSPASNTVSAALTPPADTTPRFDVVTYNIEWLGKPNKAGLSISRDQQLTDAALDILDANADIYALQEIVVDSVNGDALTDLLAKLNALDANDAWAGAYNTYFSYWWNPDFTSFPAQRQAYVYRTSTVSNASFQTLLTAEVPSGDNRFASGRLPFMMQATVTIDGVSDQITLVNLHLKCCTGNSARRLASMQTLDAELDANYSNVNVIVLGDMNVADNGGASGEMASWGLYDDSNNDGTADFSHAAGAIQDLSFNDIDHILISDELADDYAASPASVQNVILSSRSSDHDPVKTSLTLQGGPAPDTLAPSAPDSLMASAITETTVTLSWAPASDNVAVTSYQVYQGGVVIANTATTSVNVTGLTPGTNYVYSITAVDLAGNVSAASDSLLVTTTTPPDTLAPSAPDSLVASAITETTVTLSWAPASDNVAVTSYQVYQGGVVIANTATTSVNVTGLTPGTNYVYSITAVDLAGNVSAASDSLLVTTATPPDTEDPTTPSSLFAYDLTEKTLTLSWNPATDNVGVTYYEVSQDGVALGTTTGTSFTVTGLLANTSYIFAVVAVDEANNHSVPATLGVTTSASADPVTIAGYSFESGLEGWTDGGSDARLYSGHTYSWEGTNSLRLRDNSGVASSMTSPALDLSGYNQVAVDFYFYTRSMDNSSEDFWLRYNDGSGWTTVATWARNTDFQNNYFYQATVILDANTFNLVSNGQFRFQCDASSNQDWVYIDQVSITGVNSTARGTLANTLTKVHERRSMEEPVLSFTEANLSLYPNPAQDQATLSLQVAENEEVSIIMVDLQGKVVYEDSIALEAGVNQHLLPVDQLREGLYLVQVVGKETQKTLRLMVQ